MSIQIDTQYVDPFLSAEKVQKLIFNAERMKLAKTIREYIKELQQFIEEKDLSDDMKMRIQLGLISLEDALKMYQREGMADKENVFETRLLVPNGVNPRELIEDATEDDLLPVIEESTNAIDNVLSEEEQMKKDTDVSQSNLESFFGKMNLQ